MKIEALHPLHIRRASGDLHLRPGCPVELPDEEAEKLLKKVPGKVRIVTEGGTTSEPAVTADGFPLKPVYWERGDGSIVGPGQPEFFARIGCGNREEDFWLVVLFDGETAWIRSDRMCTKLRYDQQVLPKITETVKEPR